MLSEPIMNDPNNPLVSVLISNYDGQHLRECFGRIITQNILANIEIVFFDDATADGSWECAVEYAQKFKKLITLTRNKKTIGPKANFKKGESMAKGKYFVLLFNDQKFMPEYIKRCIDVMESDPFAEFAMVKRKVKNPPPLPSIQNTPLVSITVHNYNYGQYLRQCFDSVFCQTYGNIEICFSDNASTDDSWDIALEYARKYPGVMTLTRNRKNFGSEANFTNCMLSVKGKYLVELCSDDALSPKYVKQCVQLLEANPNAGFAMVHRKIIDEHGRITEEPPFYNQSCIIQGPEQAAVYMMASVNPSISQIMYKREMRYGKEVAGGVASNWYSTRIMDFNMCCENPIAYIKEPLLFQRVHSQSDTSWVATNLVDILGPYILQHQFVELAAQYDITKVAERLGPSVEKLSRLCLRYSVRFLSINDEHSALRYFHLAMALMPDIKADPIYKRLEEYWVSDKKGKSVLIQSFLSIENLAVRSVSYDPPPGSIPIEVNL